MICFITLLTSIWRLGSHFKIAPDQVELEWDTQNNTETQTLFLRLPLLLSQIIKENLAERQPGSYLYWYLFTVCFLFMFCSQTLTKYSERSGVPAELTPSYTERDQHRLHRWCCVCVLFGLSDVPIILSTPSTWLHCSREAGTTLQIFQPKALTYCREFILQPNTTFLCTSRSK